MILISLFAYIAGAMAAGSLLIGFILFFVRKLSIKQGVEVLVVTVLCVLMSMVIRELLYGKLALNQWGFYQTEFMPSWQAICKLFKETFLESDSWYSFSGGAASIGLEVPCVIAILALVRLYYFYCDVREESEVYRYRMKFISVLCLAFLLSVVLASVQPIQVGIRRVLSAIPLLIVAFSASIDLLLLPKCRKWAFPFTLLSMSTLTGATPKIYTSPGVESSSSVRFEIGAPNLLRAFSTFFAFAVDASTQISISFV